MKVIITALGGKKFLADMNGRDLEFLVKLVAPQVQVTEEVLDGKPVLVGQLHDIPDGSPLAAVPILESVQLVPNPFTEVMCNKEYAARAAGKEWEGHDQEEDLVGMLGKIFGKDRVLTDDDLPRQH